MKLSLFKTFNFSFKTFTFLFLFLLLAFSSQAQIYPVQVIPVLLPPYSLRLSDYATSTDNKLQLQVLLKDLMEPSHQIRLQFSLLSGVNGTQIAGSNPFVTGFRNITLYPGTPITLTNVDLRALFELQNLNGMSAISYAKPLPEGMYQFCFQVFDAVTGRTLSAKSCAMGYLVQYAPPVLNLPQQGEKVLKQNELQQIIFQWMPRQVAPNTRYIFTLKELWDSERDPIAGFLSSRILWQEEVYPNTLLYGIDKTALIPGKRYAWQVQAKSGNVVIGGNATEDNGVYKNNGLSEIFYFDYVEDCLVPSLLMAKNVGRGRTELRWSITGAKPSALYRVQYRKRGSSSTWVQQESYQERAIVTGLEDAIEYEYRVGSVCGSLYQASNSTDPAGNAYSYSGIQYFTTDAKESQNSNYQCGVMPQVDISNRSPLQSPLGVNEVFMAGDFLVTVLEAQGSSGTYSGTGYIQVPYLADTRLKVTFKGIGLNTDKKLISGVVETTYDVNETNVVQGTEVVRMLEDVVTVIGQSIDKLKNLLKDPIKNREEIVKEGEKLGNDYAKMIGGLPISEDEKKIKLAKYDELSKQIYTASNSDGIDEATILAAAASKTLDEFKAEVKADAEKAKTDLIRLEQIDNYYFIEKPTTFLSPANKVICLPTGTKVYFYCVDHTRTNNGVLHGFILPDGRQYYMRQNGWVGTTFVGYRDKNNEVYLSEKKENLGKQKITYLHHYQVEGQGNYEYWLVEHEVDVKGDQISAEKDFSGYIHEIEYKADRPGKNFIVILSGCGNVTDLSIAGKYKLKVTKDEKTGKLGVEFELEGKGNNKIKDSEAKKKIQDEVKKLIEEKINDLAGGKTDAAGAENKTKKVSEKDEERREDEDDGEFYVKDMNWAEWATAIGDLGCSVWENASLPEGYWNKDKDYTKSPIHIPPTLAGVSDGLISEVTEYQQLVKLGYDLATKKEVRTGLWNSVKGISLSSIRDASIKFYEEKKANYTSNKNHIVYHTIGKDGVQLVTTIIGVGAIKSAATKIDDGIEDVGKRIAKEAREKVTKEFLQSFDEVFIAKLKKIPNYEKLEAALVESWKKHHGSKFSLQYIYDNQLIDKIEAFELKIDDAFGNFTADMKLTADRVNITGKFVEFKSWGTGSFSLLNGSQYKDQLKSYMKSGSFEQIFDAKKLIADGIPNPDKFIKEKIVDMIKKNAEEFYTGNEKLFKTFDINKPEQIVEKLNLNHPLISKFIAQ